MVPFLLFLFGLAMLWQLVTALIYISVIAIFCVYAVKKHEKSQGMYDDRLPQYEIDEAIEKYIQDVRILE